MKYVIDTDIGDDIDDAFALDFALKRNLDIVCVTTVFRNTFERAKIVKKLFALCEKTIPVYAGYGDTLAGNERICGRLCQWTEDLDGYSSDGDFPEDAVNAIVKAAQLYGRELTILALGPLTNIARAIRKDPVAMAGINGVVMMGGDFKNHYSEWNIRCDVEAARQVFSSAVSLTAFGHEITSLSRLTPRQQDYVMNMKHDAYHAYLAQLSRLWYASKPEGWLMVLHDVMVARYAAEPTYCTFRNVPVAIETEGEYTAGMTVDLSLMGDYCREEGKQIRVAESVDMHEFIGCFLQTVGCGARSADEDACLREPAV